ncbi:MAG TPA: inositol-3-phosphate synthase [Kofleriaceae bacterium]|nr:inositol-3-phosphate synthase [Kofleriaceae bacterium]
MPSLGVWIVGAAGHVGSCTLIGWAGLRAGLVPPVGLATAAPPLSSLPFAGFDHVAFGGHEIAAHSLTDAAQALVAEGILAASVIEAAPVRAAIAAAEAERRLGVTVGSAAEFDRVREELRSFRERHRCDHVVVLNVASTEADPEGPPPPATPDALFAALRAGTIALAPSTIYAAAALDLGLAYVNFTPSTGADLPALHALALARGAVHAGADGKTGQTLLKTVLAPMFAIRRLQVTSWVSHNVLGNADGRALDDPARRAAKQRSKSAPLAAILGYAPESLVGIEYVPSYGDWKLAWDRIVFRGFGGAEMSLELTWRGSDTSLAAPLCIDLIRLVELAQRRGEKGVLDHLGLFFKSPIGSREHRLERQWQRLLEHLEPPPPSSGEGA